MNRWIDGFFGRTLAAVEAVAIRSRVAHGLLYLPGLYGTGRTWFSRRRAYAAFWNAAIRVPAYREFLREHAAEYPRRFEDIPPMDKQSYIRRYPFEQLLQHGRLPMRGAVIDESSGSGGMPDNWVRGPAERFAARRLLQFAVRQHLGRQPFVLLNAFALGPWATGMNVSMSLASQSVLKSVGPDVSKIRATLQLLGPGYRYVIMGYPPFLKVLVETADIEWAKYDVSAVVGGEGMSERLRSVLNRSFRRTISSYGASDLEINLAVETDFTVALRQVAAGNPAFARDLFGSSGLPMIFQFDPLHYYLETDSEGSLLVTINRLANVSPRIRYNIRDRAAIVPMPMVQRILDDHRIRLDHAGLRIPLPLLLHWGRQDHAVGFYGCKITPDDVQAALARIPAIGDVMAEYALHPYEDADANKRLEIFIELKPGKMAPPDLAGVTSDVLRELAAGNQDFRESIRMVPVERAPTLRVFPAGNSPMSGQDLRIKKRYVI